MDEFTQMERYTVLRRNNNVLRWLARQLDGEPTQEGNDEEIGLEIVGLVYRGWSISLGCQEVDDDSHFRWWAVCSDGKRIEPRVCRCTTHLLHSIRKHCQSGSTESVTEPADRDGSRHDHRQHSD